MLFTQLDLRGHGHVWANEMQVGLIVAKHQHVESPTQHHGVQRRESRVGGRLRWGGAVDELNSPWIRGGVKMSSGGVGASVVVVQY